MPQLDLDLLKTFLAIADAGSLTRAAGDVGRTQSAVSMQVRRIEEIVEGPVLLRTPRGVELTARGQRLLAHARRLVKAHDEGWSTSPAAALPARSGSAARRTTAAVSCPRCCVRSRGRIPA